MSEYITIVAGLPRTGTSMMMRMLEAGGMEPVTDNIRTADIDNPNGYYEFEKVKKIKEDKSWLPETRGKYFKMVSMLLFDLPPDYEYRVIFTEREMAEMLASQRKMLIRLGRLKEDDDGKEMARLYGKHLVDIKKWLGGQKNIKVLYVKYNDILGDPHGNAKAVDAFLGRGLDTGKMAAVIDKGLYRNRVTG